jgi:hypothetical protein
MQIHPVGAEVIRTEGRMDERTDGRAEADKHFSLII